MVEARELAPDTAQELAAEKLQLLANRLAQYSEPRLGRLLPFARRRRSAPGGLYLYGGVGRGKTMLLDLFFETVHYAPKRRVYFQEFMAEAHLRPSSPSGIDLAAMVPDRAKTRPPCACAMRELPVTKAVAVPGPARYGVNLRREPWHAVALH
jgi:predicted ATPase